MGQPEWECPWRKLVLLLSTAIGLLNPFIYGWDHVEFHLCASACQLGLLLTPVLFRQTYRWDWWMPFPYYIMSRGHNLSTGVLGIWFLQSFPLPWFFLSLGFKGCISDLYIHSFSAFWSCVHLCYGRHLLPKKELLWWWVRAHLSVRMRVGIQKTVMTLL